MKTEFWRIQLLEHCPMPRFWKLVGRALRLVCPLCGRGGLFRGFLAMNEHCPHCQVKFEREPGFFLGSIYINYGITALVTSAVAITMILNNWRSTPEQLGIALAIAILLPVFLHRHARSLWLGFDQWRDPQPGEE